MFVIVLLNLLLFTCVALSWFSHSQTLIDAMITENLTLMINLEKMTGLTQRCQAKLLPAMQSQAKLFIEQRGKRQNQTQ